MPNWHIKLGSIPKLLLTLHFEINKRSYLILGKMNDIEIIRSKIYEIRGQNVMLDRNLAEMYGVETRAINQAVKRNSSRFPDDFMFQLSKDEWEYMSSQIVMTSLLKRPKTAIL